MNLIVERQENRLIIVKTDVIFKFFQQKSIKKIENYNFVIFNFFLIYCVRIESCCTTKIAKIYIAFE